MVDEEPIFKRHEVPPAAREACLAAGGTAVSRAASLAWARLLAEPQTLQRYGAWSGQEPLPGWLSELLQRFLVSEECQVSKLWAMSPMAARLCQWLRARLECHRVLMRMEEDRQNMGDLSTQLLEVWPLRL